MTSSHKALQKIRQNPKNVRFEEIDALLRSFGFEKRQKGSHAVFTRADLQLAITIPYRKPFILPVYVKQILKLLDEISDEE
jgi:predicted RNA binding protein YcfA (HicA-like mRNA interferase family)